MVKKKVSKKKANKSSNNFNRNLLIGAVIIILIFVVAFNFAGKGSDEEGLAQSPPVDGEDEKNVYGKPFEPPILQKRCSKKISYKIKWNDLTVDWKLVLG